MSGIFLSAKIVICFEFTALKSEFGLPQLNSKWKIWGKHLHTAEPQNHRVLKLLMDPNYNHTSTFVPHLTSILRTAQAACSSSSMAITMSSASYIAKNPRQLTIDMDWEIPRIMSSGNPYVTTNYHNPHRITWVFLHSWIESSWTWTRCFCSKEPSFHQEVPCDWFNPYLQSWQSYRWKLEEQNQRERERERDIRERRTKYLEAPATHLGTLYILAALLRFIINHPLQWVRKKVAPY